MVVRLFSAICIALISAVQLSCAQNPGSLTAAYPDSLCTSCTEWNTPQEPFRIHGNTFFVGTRGLSAILITSAEGHILIDAALPNSAPLILENIRSLGFNPEDVRLILNSHSHFDHAGGIAAIQHVSGARVAASPESAPVLECGRGGPDDPQYGLLLDFPPSKDVERFTPGDILRLGSLQVVSHPTAGHSPGGTSWSWRSCEEASCLDIVYADSQTPVSADSFRFMDSRTALEDFSKGHRALEQMPCDVLITTHPGASSLWERLEGPGLVDSFACRRYAASARRQLERRLATERTAANLPDRRVAVTVDDLPGSALLFEQETPPSCDAELLRDLTNRLLEAFNGLPATGFVTESQICDELRFGVLPQLLEAWLEAGHDLGNHTFSHRAFENSGREFFEADVIRGEAVSSRLLDERGRRLQYFRYPFLHAPADSAEKAAFESFLSARGYTIAPVTLDNDEWIYAAAYARALDRGDDATAARIGIDYVRYMEEVFLFNEAFSRDLLKREIPQILLIHANHLNADYFDNLRAMILRRGYRFVPLDEAMEDEAFGRPDPYLGERGLSWLQRLAVGAEGKTRHEPRAPEWVRRLADVGD